MLIPSRMTVRSIKQSIDPIVAPLLRLGSKVGSVGLRTEVPRGGSRLGEESGKDWMDEGTEQDLSTSSLGKRHPEDKDEFEGVIECYSQCVSQYLEAQPWGNIRNQ